MDYKSLMYLNQFNHADKEIMCKNLNSKIDKGIRELVDAINSIDVFCTMNSCQGTLIIKEKTNHCPRTYVDFYVLYHHYELAHLLFGKLIHKFGSILNCKIEYEADFEVKNEDYVEDNGLINMRFRIEIIDAENLVNSDTIYKEIIQVINTFKEDNI